MTPKGAQQPASCALCGRELTAKEEEVCSSDPNRFGGQLLCAEHQRRFSKCRAVRGL